MIFLARVRIETSTRSVPIAQCNFDRFLAAHLLLNYHLWTPKHKLMIRRNGYAISIPNGGSTNVMSQIKIPYVAAKHRVSGHISQQTIIHRLWLIHRDLRLACSRFSGVLTGLALSLTLTFFEARADQAKLGVLQRADSLRQCERSLVGSSLGSEPGILPCRYRRVQG